jgi:hypothetical protein
VRPSLGLLGCHVRWCVEDADAIGLTGFYLRTVAKFAQDFCKSPDQLDRRHVREYLIHWGNRAAWH